MKSREDRLVLIENQLERTDHTHLGQLITYTAGLATATIVWVAAEFTEEHRATLDWLNSATDDHFRFFGLEVQVWRIGRLDEGSGVSNCVAAERLDEAYT